MTSPEQSDAQSAAAMQPPNGGVLDVIKSYRRQLPLFFAVATLIFLAVAAYTWTRVPRYTATAAVEVSPRKPEVGTDRSAALNDPTTDASVDTQVEVLRSPALLGLVVDQLRLSDNPVFNQLTHTPGTFERLGFSSGGDEKPLTREERRLAAIDAIKQNLEVHRVAQTFMLEIAVTTTDPGLTSRIANAIAQGYISQSLQIKLGAAGNAGGLLGPQLSRAAAEAKDAETALNRYKIANNLVMIGGGTMAEQELTNLDAQLAQAQASESEAEARYSTARQQMARGSNGEDVGEALTSPVVQELRRQRAEVVRQMAELSNRYGPKYPALSAAQQELQSIDGQIHSEVNRIISSLEAQTQVASRRSGSLAGSRNQTRSAVASNNVASVRLADLQSRATASRTLYEELLARVREISTQAATTQSDARIATFAVAPERPSSPNIPINLLVGALLGIAGGVAAVVIRQGLDQGLTSLEDVEVRLNLPYLASLPTLESSVGKPHGDDPIAAMLTHPGSAYAEAFRSLAASVLQGKTGVKSVLLTSSLPNEGKTTAAICLARIIAMGGKRVVLVDADLRRPSVAAGLQLRPTVGSREVISGQATLQEALITDTETGLDVLPVLNARDHRGSPIEGGQFATLIDQLKSMYDVVILDGSPILPVVDSRILATTVDAVIFLVRWRKTPETAVEMAAHLMVTVGATVAGVALSRVDLRAMAKSGYGDPAKYFKLYENYYHN